MIEKWLDLLSSMEIIENLDYGIEIPSTRELEKFEAQVGMVLPSDFKNFCSFFGTGGFSSDLRIYCPPDLGFSEIALTAIKNEINMFPHGQSRFMDVDDIRDLLDSALLFGDSSCADIFFGDLRTYNELDRSYDIYWADGDVFNGNIRQLGRNFFEFVRDFGVGTKLYEIIPLKIQLPSEQISPTFTRFMRR
jgi:hypothetical protein